MRRVPFLVRLAILAAASTGIEAASAEPIYLDQGRDWTAAERGDYYTRDQGGRLSKLNWLQALKSKDGKPFLFDSMARYGFLPNPGNTDNLPVGLHTTGPNGSQLVGVSCAACHTRQLEVSGKTYRVDGGPGFVDFQAFMVDLDKAVGDVLASDAAFAPFAAAVLQSATPAAADVSRLRQRVEAWYRRYHAFVTATLPSASPERAWGPGRLDAVGIIFNRLSGLEVGPPPDRLIPENMRLADAPVRYPFLWNSPIQDLTDWGGFVMNGNTLYALARNTGQALAFADFVQNNLFGLFYTYATSINFEGLGNIEKVVKKKGPPKWPWPVDTKLAAEGEKIYKRECSDGCHGKTEKHSLLGTTWQTPVKNVGTDTRQYDELGWKVKTGVLEGAGIPFIAKRLDKEDFAVHMMFTAVAGSIGEYFLLIGGGNPPGDGFGTSATPTAPVAASSAPRSPPQASQVVADASNAAGGVPRAEPPQSLTIESGTLLERTLNRGAYEARVLEGIWAAAPYLHNGSVPTLAELLKPSAQRVSKFNVGAKYDIENVGIAVGQDGWPLPSTGCDDLNSGNSRCGHEYGTSLSERDKKALIEYLKTL